LPLQQMQGPGMQNRAVAPCGRGGFQDLMGEGCRWWSGGNLGGRTDVVADAAHQMTDSALVVWLVELGYAIVARRRSFFSRLLPKDTPTPPPNHN